MGIMRLKVDEPSELDTKVAVAGSKHRQETGSAIGGAVPAGIVVGL